MTYLQHETGNDTVELAALVVERLALFARALLPRAQCAEVLDGLGHCLPVQAHCDPAGPVALQDGLAVHLNVEVHLGSALRLGVLLLLLLLGEGAAGRGGEQDQAEQDQEAGAQHVLVGTRDAWRCVVWRL